MRPLPELVVNHPANAGLRRYCEVWQPPGRAALRFPDDVERPYDSLGTHPDLVARLWDELGGVLPADCRAIFYNRPALVHPVTGIVFGFAGGSRTYALRLPEAEHREAIAAGAARITHYPKSSFDLADVGEEWVFGGWYRAEHLWCRAAYDHAAGAA